MGRTVPFGTYGPNDRATQRVALTRAIYAAHTTPAIYTCVTPLRSLAKATMFSRSTSWDADAYVAVRTRYPRRFPSSSRYSARERNLLPEHRESLSPLRALIAGKAVADVTPRPAEADPNRPGIGRIAVRSRFYGTREWPMSDANAAGVAQLDRPSWEFSCLGTK